ncbi:MAG: ASCH domain-containing protein [Candidatus Saccharibacteria bacterium]
MNSHQLQLASEPFNAIVRGTKTIESRLDEITFTNRDEPSQKATVQVIGLLRYETFHDLFSHNDPAKFGGASVEWLENQINNFYSFNSQIDNGVLGIEFELISLSARLGA